MSVRHLPYEFHSLDQRPTVVVGSEEIELDCWRRLKVGLRKPNPAARVATDVLGEDRVAGERPRGQILCCAPPEQRDHEVGAVVASIAPGENVCEVPIAGHRPGTESG